MLNVTVKLFSSSSILGSHYWLATGDEQGLSFLQINHES